MDEDPTEERRSYSDNELLSENESNDDSFHSSLETGDIPEGNHGFEVHENMGQDQFEDDIDQDQIDEENARYEEDNVSEHDSEQDTDNTLDYIDETPSHYVPG
jgi:hypothetical protein